MSNYNIMSIKYIIKGSPHIGYVLNPYFFKITSEYSNNIVQYPFLIINETTDPNKLMLSNDLKKLPSFTMLGNQHKNKTNLTQNYLINLSKKLDNFKEIKENENKFNELDLKFKLIIFMKSCTATECIYKTDKKNIDIIKIDSIYNQIDDAIEKNINSKFINKKEPIFKMHKSFKEFNYKYPDLFENIKNPYFKESIKMPQEFLKYVDNDLNFIDDLIKDG